jgi:hypothetical protein
MNRKREIHPNPHRQNSYRIAKREAAAVITRALNKWYYPPEIYTQKKRNQIVICMRKLVDKLRK